MRLEGKKLRSAKEREAILKRLVYPKLGSKPIADIRRKDISDLIDGIHERNGPVMADITFMILRRIFSQYAVKNEDFRNPIIRGMRQAHHKRRERVLSDEELRAVWRAAETRKGLFDRYIQLVLLTAVRRNEAALTRRQEVVDATWTIPKERMKGGKTEHVVPLSQDAKRILASIPAIGSEGWVFTFNGKKPVMVFARLKPDLQRRSNTTGWTIHDLRRTARSLMSRGGVLPDIAERCLAHAIPGIRATYDKHAYFSEKRLRSNSWQCRSG